jgi:hypothetical protein
VEKSFDVEHTANELKGIFSIRREGKRAAELTYTVAGSAKMSIKHTQVNDVLRGSGAGVALVVAAVDWARKLQ